MVFHLVAYGLSLKDILFTSYHHSSFHMLVGVMCPYVSIY